ncbi:MAG: hypothetical protein FWD66_06360 [Paludibacter sp.]|nr:hypothetical protein [Paludibacter sp.]
MVNNEWNDLFIEMLYKKYPKRKDLIKALIELLHIEREAIYRRLRKDIIFPTNEIIQIASNWNISMDDIIGVHSENAIFKMQLWNFINPSEKELHNMKTVIDGVKVLKKVPNVEYMEVCNKFPRVIVCGFPYLQRLDLLKWMYLYSNLEVLPFSKILTNEKVIRLSTSLRSAIKYLGTVSFIWDSLLFHYAVCDIQFFHSIYLINDQEKEILKNNLYALLDYMSTVTHNGCWPETGNKVNLYISYINIDTNYLCYHCDGETKLFSISVFGKNELYTQNPIQAEQYREWMMSKKRSSIQISEADEKSRIEYFMKQRKTIDDL